MTKQSPTTLAVGIIAAEIAALDAGAGPERIKITPAGRVTTRDGRSYVFEPASLVARFKADGIDLPIDFDHATARRGALGERVDAVGWIKELEARPDGTYGRVDWLEPGRAALSARSHRYISPTFQYDDSGRATWLHSVALVNAPALAMPALADASAKPAALTAVAKALGIDTAAGEADILAAIGTLKGDNKVALDSLAGAISRVNAEQFAITRARHETKVDEHIGRGCFPPALREWALALCASNEQSFDDFVSRIGTPLGYLFKSPITPEMEARALASRIQSPEMTDLASNIARQLGVKPETLA